MAPTQLTHGHTVYQGSLLALLKLPGTASNEYYCKSLIHMSSSFWVTLLLSTLIHRSPQESYHSPVLSFQPSSNVAFTQSLQVLEVTLSSHIMLHCSWQAGRPRQSVEAQQQSLAISPSLSSSSFFSHFPSSVTISPSQRRLYVADGIQRAGQHTWKGSCHSLEATICVPAWALCQRWAASARRH